jgi:hypothetical protein
MDRRAGSALQAAAAVISGRACLTPAGAEYLGVTWLIVPALWIPPWITWPNPGSRRG